MVAMRLSTKNMWSIHTSKEGRDICGSTHEIGPLCHLVMVQFPRKSVSWLPGF